MIGGLLGQGGGEQHPGGRLIAVVGIGEREEDRAAGSGHPPSRDGEAEIGGQVERRGMGGGVAGGGRVRAVGAVIGDGGGVGQTGDAFGHGGADHDGKGQGAQAATGGQAAGLIGVLIGRANLGPAGIGLRGMEAGMLG